MYTIYLQESDLLYETHFPIIALINEACNSDVIEFVHNLTEGIGCGYNYTNCSFWDDLDDYDKSQITKFDGVLIDTDDGEEVTVSVKVVLYYLDIVFIRLKNVGFIDIQNLQDALSALKNKYC